MPLIDVQPDALATTYARTLFVLAEAQGGKALIESVLGELEDILELTRQDTKFGEFMSSRVLSTAKRDASLRRMFGNAVSPITLNFLLLLNRKGRLWYLIPIVSAFDAVVQERFGRVEVDVFTAEPMSADDVRAVREKLAKSLNKEVIVHPYTDGSMIGGVKFRIGDQLVDASLATRLRKLRDQLANQGSAALRSRIDRLFN